MKAKHKGLFTEVINNELCFGFHSLVFQSFASIIYSEYSDGTSGTYFTYEKRVFNIQITT